MTPRSYLLAAFLATFTLGACGNDAVTDARAQSTVDTGQTSVADPDEHHDHEDHGEGDHSDDDHADHGDHEDHDDHGAEDHEEHDHDDHAHAEQGEHSDHVELSQDAAAEGRGGARASLNVNRIRFEQNTLIRDRAIPL